MDSIVLYPPGGAASPIQLGSWLKADPPPNFGAAGLRQSFVTETVLDGGRLSHERLGVRKMRFGLGVRAAGALDMLEWEGQIRSWARPGAYIDVQPNGVPSAEAVRFDVIAGRYEEDYHVHHNRVGYRAANLHLDTQPYGYWPTWITAASAASWGILPLPLASIVGDLPAPVELVVQPTVGSVGAIVGGTGMALGAAYGMHGHASFPFFLRAASWVDPVDTKIVTGAATLMTQSDPFPFSQMLRWPLNDNSGSWGILAYHRIPPSAMAPVAGRYRVFLHGSIDAEFNTRPGDLTFDVAGANLSFPLASSNPLATFSTFFQGQSNIGSAAGGALYDLGEHTIPSAQNLGNVHLRVWMRSPSANYTATPFANMSGIFLVPVDGAVVRRGMAAPHQLGAQPSQGKLLVSPQGVMQAEPLANLASHSVWADIGAYHHGPRPYVNASTRSISVLPMHALIPVSNTYGHPSGLFPPGLATKPMAAVSVRYQPRFAFLKGL